MITKEYLDEQSQLLIEVYRNKKDLNLFLTSGNKHCFDITYEEKYVNKLPEIIFERFTYKNIYCDSRYISIKLAKEINTKYKNVIIKLYNNNEYDTYKDLECINYIDNIEHYNHDIKNIYILRDDNIDLNILSYDLEIVEYNLTIFNDDVKKIFTYHEFNKLSLPWEEYRKWLLRDQCLANNSLVLDVHTLSIIICPALNEKAFYLGKIYDNEISAFHTDIAIRTIISNEKKDKLECCNCVLFSICKQQCYYKSYLKTQDPFLKNEDDCVYSLQKASFFANLYDKAKVREKAIENNDQEIINFINKYLLRG